MAQAQIERPEWTASGPKNVSKLHHGPHAAESGDSSAERDDGSDALQLVDQLAEAVRSREERAAQVEALARALGKRALDELTHAVELYERIARQLLIN